MEKLLQINLERHMNLDGAYNVRDLGGYPTRDGNMTRWGKYYRGDSLHKLPVTGQKHLYEIGIRSIVDLRIADSEGPYQFHESLNIQYENIPLLNPIDTRYDRPKSLVELYCDLLDSRQESILQIMQHFVISEAHPVLFHCKAGKDRTGVIAALLLDLLGVDHNIIAEDYALTAQNILPIRDQLLSDRDHSNYMDEEHYIPLLQCPPEFMYEFLAYLYDRYQGTESYLKQIGLHWKEIDLLKKHFVGG